ncbi:DUF1761 domain-containing protein [Candidatus Woesearchaeota archaeon]|nr:DUF1761 domain-containing protein [Candidatus Woesearchaeota archaeon]
MVTLRLFVVSLIVTVFLFLFGYIWFELFFKKQWMASLFKYQPWRRKEKPRKGEELKFLSVIFLLTLLIVLTLGFTMQRYGILDGFKLGLLFWIVYALIEYMNNLALKVPGRLQLISSLYWLIVLVTAGSVFAVAL